MVFFKVVCFAVALFRVELGIEDVVLLLMYLLGQHPFRVY